MWYYKINLYNTYYETDECYYRKADCRRDAVNSIKNFLWWACNITSCEEVEKEEVEKEEKKWMWIWWLKL